MKKHLACQMADAQGRAARELKERAKRRLVSEVNDAAGRALQRLGLICTATNVGILRDFVTEILRKAAEK